MRGEEYKLRELDPDQINEVFRHKDILVPSQDTNNNVMRRKEFWVSKAEKEHNLNRFKNFTSTTEAILSGKN